MLTDSARPILQQTAGDLSAFAFLIATTTSTISHAWLFYIDARDLNSGLHAYKINSLTPEPQPVCIVTFFLKLNRLLNWTVLVPSSYQNVVGICSVKSGKV